jgi:geranylgeranyl pyrophosphate synthase
VLCAEGSALVTSIIQTGQIDAIVGVSCLPVLEKTFPYMEAAAIPGVAIPLLQDDCRETSVDIDWVWDVIHLTSDDWTYRLDLDALRGEVESWFEPCTLEKVLGPARSETEQIAWDWLTKSGKRWRPFLAACAYKALSGDPKAPLPKGLHSIAIAVECFHKASLIHDDIEDGDLERYGERTLHEEHSLPVALNVGDLLLGEGYRLIAESDAPPMARSEMIRAAASGHRTLCLGQGAELCWARDPTPLTPLEVLEIFRQKTSPAFEVALRLGTIYADHTRAEGGMGEVLSRYSESLGIAYQIRDDLEDLAGEASVRETTALRPWLPLAVAHERAKGEAKAKTEAAWTGKVTLDECVRTILSDPGTLKRCHSLLDSFREEAVRSLAELENPALKGLLRRVVTKIFGVEMRGWCSEFETRNATGREAGAAATG